ncbi:zinc finger protein CO3-like, partial [Typha angustifolia]|uniref:zinc finger protein CO3-like n=1 Tax=Typha angustifolia TaxID=59011 RepID=UPI003C2F40B9
PGGGGGGGRWAPPRSCDSCRSAPSAVYCRADSAALCAACDADVHSANSLARRHHRVPVLPPSAGGFVVRPGLYLSNNACRLFETEEKAAAAADTEEEDDEASSWLLLNPLKGGDGYSLGNEVDEFLDLGDENTFNEGQKEMEYCNGKSEGSEFVVPNEQQQGFQIEFEASKDGFDYSSSLSHSVSMSSLEASVVPETTTTTDMSSSYLRPCSKGTIDLFSCPPVQIPPQFIALDREARVLRYREKRKARKFEKTIRYASRKAYAETRPRIKGRFAKRSDVELEVDQFFSASVLAESSYGVVPTF